MTPEELQQYDGKSGHKAYIAVNGKIYDVTDSPLWSDGDHQGEHQAGCDLTEALKTAPHVRAVVEQFTVVGELSPPAPRTRGSGIGQTWIIVAVLAALALALVVALSI
jgi:predicted heme/steroid binding protein